MKTDLARKPVVDLMPHALFTVPSGKESAKLRKLLQPAFGPKYIRLSKEMSETHIVMLEKHLSEKLIKRNYIDICACEFSSHLTFDTLGQVSFGRDFNCIQDYIQGNENRPLSMVHLIDQVIMNRIGIPMALWPWTGHAFQGSIISSIHSIFQQTIEAAYQRHDKPEENIMARLIAQDVLTPQELEGSLMGIIHAGTDTTAKTLTHALVELALNPSVQDQLRQEINAKWDKDEFPTLLEFDKFDYLEWVIKETLRLHTLVPFLPRQTTKATEILGHCISKGEHLRIFVAGIHVAEEYWKEPKRFNPQRFSEPIIPGSYYPFGSGVRNCVGQKMAMMELKVMDVDLGDVISFD